MRGPGEATLVYVPYPRIRLDVTLSSTTRVPPPLWHALEAVDVIERLESSRSGLSDRVARERLGEGGPNQLPAPRPKTWYAILWDQVRSVVMGLLAAAMLVSWLTGDPIEAAAIGAVIVINALIGFTTEFRARRAIRALARLQADLAVVVRDGDRFTVPATQVVPGDLVGIEEGDRVPADLRLVESSGLRVNEAILTGESLPVVKDENAQVPEAAGLHGRTTMVYQGTAVVGGSALGVVTGTAERTEVGRIGRMLEAAPDDETPLEKKLDSLGHRLIGATVAVAALVIMVGLVRGMDWTQTVKTGIALAVAAVPEGLPAIATIALAIGVRRMARRNALVRRLPSVETLGSVTVVCTDKTGTLTTGQMEVARLWTPDPHGERALAETSVMANRMALIADDSESAGRFDPTEVALVEYAKRVGVDPKALHDSRPIIQEIPFTAERRMMATRHQTSDGPRWFAKGALAAILDSCDTVRHRDGDLPLSPKLRAELDAANDRLAAEGLRVLAFAVSRNGRDRPTAGSDTGAPLSGLTLLGLAGLIDPPAPGVAETVQTFADAGIRVVMITGDHRLTAGAIGQAVGIGTSASLAVDVEEWSRAGNVAFGPLVSDTPVLARVSPEKKLDIVRALQSQGEIVAMLGDGVNDAAALKASNIGVAMGRRGAEVARQASDVILQDDRFESIGAAVAEGRVVFANIRKFAIYLFSCNLAEVFVLLTAGLLGWPTPLLPLQILWLNLVTDTFPALSLAFEPAEEDLMQRSPRPPESPILGRSEVWGIVLYATVLTAVTLVACFIGLRGEPEGGARTMTLTFTTLACAQVFHLGNVRSRAAVLAPSRATSNGFALAGAAVSLVLLVLAVTWEPLSRLLEVSPLNASDWLLVVGLAATPAVVGQALKLVGQPAAAFR